MSEIIFSVVDSPEGGYEARAMGFSIFTHGDDMEELKKNIKEAIQCHFDFDLPKFIRLHYSREEFLVL